jgi:hypothetical protein
MDILSTHRFTKRHKIVNLNITRPAANDEGKIAIDPDRALSLAEKLALRAGFDSLAPVIAINRSKSKSERQPLETS